MRRSLPYLLTGGALGIAVLTAVLASILAPVGHARVASAPWVPLRSGHADASLIVAGQDRVDLVSAVTGRLEQRLYAAPPGPVIEGRLVNPDLDAVPAPGGLVVAEGPTASEAMTFVSAATGAASPIGVGKSPSTGPGGELAYLIPPMTIQRDSVSTDAVLALRGGPGQAPLRLAATSQPVIWGRDVALSADGTHLALTTGQGGNDQLEIYDLTRPASPDNPRHYPPVASLVSQFWADPVFLDPTHVAVVASCSSGSCGSQVLDVALGTGSTRRIYRSSLRIDQALYGPDGSIRYLVANPAPPARHLPTVSVRGGVREAVLFGSGLPALYRVTAAGPRLLRRGVSEAATVPAGWPASAAQAAPSVVFRPARLPTGYPVLTTRAVGGYIIYIFGGPGSSGQSPVLGEVVDGPNGQVAGGSSGGLSGPDGEAPIVSMGGGGGHGFWNVDFMVDDPVIEKVQLRVGDHVADSMVPVDLGGTRAGVLLLVGSTMSVPAELVGLDASGHVVARSPAGVPPTCLPGSTGPAPLPCLAGS